jgi:putative nucleotidyltransferase with HDIG domain
VAEVGSKRRILIVDDEAAVCALLSERLGPAGFDCQTSSSGEHALELLASQAFDAIISDLNMPGISGLELLESARKKHPLAAFLMVTGVNDLSVAIQAMKQGADDYLVKPFQFDVVLASVRRALETKDMAKQLENYRHHLEEMVEQRTRQVQAAMKRIELTYDETLEALGAALDLRDNETAGHSQRVSRYCMEIAKAVGVEAERLKHIERGAYLHDIGKIGIPDAILLKPGRLTPEEMQIMESHARIGYNLVSRIAFLAPAAEIVLTHQERFDGTGYPQGLLGEEIPLGSRIFAVADTLDAMTSDRPYRRALPFAAARAEIERESGRQFDPEVVKVFFALPEQTWQTIRTEVANQRPRTNAHVPINLGSPVPVPSVASDIQSLQPKKSKAG